MVVAWFAGAAGGVGGLLNEEPEEGTTGFCSKGEKDDLVSV